MRRLIQIPAALAALGLLILPGCKEKPSPAPGFGADVLATVNGDAIAVPEFYAAFAAARSGREAALPDDAMSRLQIKSVFLSELVDKKLLEQQSRGAPD
ncbi:MAG: SurA N-terminal domain-containing protein [Deltaproteobacteria bacterium]|nr:SurA N-terminal domain-containing protein [Deltaproteobacteria bacterium]